MAMRYERVVRMYGINSVGRADFSLPSILTFSAHANIYSVEIIRKITEKSRGGSKVEVVPRMDAPAIYRLKHNITKTGGVTESPKLT